ncbi:MAG: DUF4175 domain-containing protein, partial [Gemmobacter sp.]|nr:DUF4175 domain-containing protein [Gemmobacter sp.]
MTSIDQTRSLALWRLRWQIRITRAGLCAERGVRAFWPVWTVLFALLGALALGLSEWVSGNVMLGIIAVSAFVMIGFAVRGATRFRMPSQMEALTRLDATMKGRPLAALADTQAIGAADPASAAVWVAHVQRMADRAATARAPGPDLRVSASDPFALRYLALTVFAVALLFGTLGRVAGVHGLAPGGANALAAGPVWEGWIRPPAYTGKPALYLNDVDAAALDLPQGSRVVLRFYGNIDTLGVAETVSGAPLAQSAATGAEFEVTRAGTIEITGAGGRTWDITLLADLPPTITATGVMEREADGKMKQPFEARDDYGVVSGRAEISLDLPAVDRRFGLGIDPEPRADIVLDLPLPFRGDRTEVRETLIDDMSKHPFANLPVIIRLTAQDIPGQEGQAAPIALPLPGKRFFDPLAAALIEARRDLLWNVSNGPRVVQILRAVTNRPEGFIRNERAFLRLRVAMRRLEASLSPALTPDVRDEVAEALWEIALLVEEGDLASALERLKRAQDRLDEAMKNGASESEIAELMQELRDAMDNYMRQLAEEAQRSPDQQMSDLQGMQMTGDQLQELLDKLQQLMEEGKMAEAQELMEMLRQLMENMQVTQGPGGQGQGQGEQSMRDLSEALRDQQGLSDEAFRDLQEGFNPGEQGQDGQNGQQDGQGQQPNGQPGQGQPGQGQPGQGQGQGQGEDQRSLAERQRDLRNRLGALGQGNLPGEGSDRGEAGRRSLDRAGRSMEGAEQALRDGDLPGALDRQAEAMEALREGMREFGEALAEEQGRQPGGQQPGQDFGRADPNGSRDPLGREPGQMGRLGSD